MIKNINATTWTNTSEVTTLVAGDGISITTDSNNNPVIEVTSSGGNGTVIVNSGNSTLNSSTSVYSYTWDVPDGVTAAKVTLVGAGGAGGNANGISGSTEVSQLGSGGGAGALVIAYITGLSGGSATINIGSQGVVGNGFDSIFTLGTITLTAAGGKAGSPTSIPNFLNPGGAGGVAMINPGSTNIPYFLSVNGENGGSSYMVNTTGSGSLYFTGRGGSSFLGGAASGLIGGDNTGVNASNDSGSGGSGAIAIATDRVGGEGGNGVCIIEY